MKVLLINGSPRENGNTARALKEVADTLAAEGIETETVWIGKKPVRGCCACYQCIQKSLGHCIFDDDIANRIIEKLPTADAFVAGAPTGNFSIIRRCSHDTNRCCFSHSTSSRYGYFIPFERKSI